MAIDWRSRNPFFAGLKVFVYVLYDVWFRLLDYAGAFILQGEY